MVKILFNFTAKYIGYDEVMKSQWNKARKYVRYNADPIKGRASNKPFWGEESKKFKILG